MACKGGTENSMIDLVASVVKFVSGVSEMGAFAVFEEVMYICSWVLQKNITYGKKSREERADLHSVLAHKICDLSSLNKTMLL